ncbi:MAG: response regulator transcription factor [Baekduiaceae bacterium]
MADPRASVLVIDDELDLRLALRALLGRAGFAVQEAPDGREGLRMLVASHPDIVLLDVEMPVIDGWGTLERIRELDEQLPVLMLTARGREMERVRGLRTGADDYLVKPYGNQELLARIDLLLRKRPAPLPAAYVDRHLEVDFARREVRVAGALVELTGLEFRLLAAFVRRPDVVLTRDDLAQHVWSGAAAGDAVRSAVRHLRRRLGWGDDGPIRSVRGVGYRYVSVR